MKQFVLPQIVNHISCCSPGLNILSRYFVIPRKTKRFILRQSHILLLFYDFEYTKLVFHEPTQNEAVCFASDCQSCILLLSRFKYTKLLFRDPAQNEAVHFALDCQSHISLLFYDFKYTKLVFHEPTQNEVVHFASDCQSRILLLSRFKYTKLLFRDPAQNEVLRFALDCRFVASTGKPAVFPKRVVLVRVLDFGTLQHTASPCRGIAGIHGYITIECFSYLIIFFRRIYFVTP
jgi:hypothetical protein